MKAADFQHNWPVMRCDIHFNRLDWIALGGSWCRPRLLIETGKTVCLLLPRPCLFLTRHTLLLCLAYSRRFIYHARAPTRTSQWVREAEREIRGYDGGAGDKKVYGDRAAQASDSQYGIVAQLVARTIPTAEDRAVAGSIPVCLIFLPSPMAVWGRN
jgi:hypothetical protein